MLTTFAGVTLLGAMCRWLGHLLMWMITFHGIAQYACWINMHTWREYFTAWNGVAILQKNDIFLAGSIAWIGALPLWITSMDWCRRRFFSVRHSCSRGCCLSANQPLHGRRPAEHAEPCIEGMWAVTHLLHAQDPSRAPGWPMDH